MIETTIDRGDAEPADPTEAAWRHLASSELLEAQDVMTEEPIAVHPTHTLRALVELLISKGLDSVPVVSRTGQPLGIAGVADVLERAVHGIVRRGLARRSREPRARPLVHEPVLRSIRFLDAACDDTTVADVLRPCPEFARPEMPLLEVTALLLEGRNEQVFVVEGGRLVGLVTRTDVMRALFPPSHSGWRSLHKLGQRGNRI